MLPERNLNLGISPPVFTRPVAGENARGELPKNVCK